MRAYLALAAFDIPFRETVVAMYRPETRERMLSFGPSGKVPVLVDGAITVWDSLAIIEHLADRFPDHAIWPREQTARSHARAASAEMHSGFTALRGACPLNLTKLFAPQHRGDGVAADVERIVVLWRDARRRFGADGAFLYSDFCGADAMFAPVASRLRTYGFDLPDDARAYVDAIHGHAAFLRWRNAAFREPWALPHYEEGETAITVLYEPSGEEA